jgi:polysaccharide export outer membrane protein
MAASALALALAATGCSTPTAVNPPPAPEMLPYRVGPPDRLEITILPDPAIQRFATVRPDGMISIDLVGDVPAAGRTTEEIAADIETRIGRFKRDARVTVALGAALSSEVTVLGEISRPATFPLSRQTRVVEAIGTVSGTTIFSNKDSIRLIRYVEGKPVIYTVDLDAIQNGDLRTNYVLQGGDLIYVPPTLLARFGYAMKALLFPFQDLISLGATAASYSGGL